MGNVSDISELVINKMIDATTQEIDEERERRMRAEMESAVRRVIDQALKNERMLIAHATRLREALVHQQRLARVPFGLTVLFTLVCLGLEYWLKTEQAPLCVMGLALLLTGVGVGASLSVFYSIWYTNGSIEWAPKSRHLSSPAANAS